MTWIICIVAYFLLVFLFLRFFHFVAETDREIEMMNRERGIK